jgi:predicted CxxxxCH...CXXCH cytochrome family protein
VPTSYADPGHVDSLPPADVSFSAIAKTNGANPTWTGTTCTGSYCHGATLDGGKHTAPSWTTVDGTQIACDSCHGNPPGGTHPPSTDCASCHTAVINADGTFKAPELHINGKVELNSLHPAGYAAADKHGADFNSGVVSCTSSNCHGDTLLGASGPSCNKCHSGWQTKCNFCHGSATDPSGAPPASVSGATATSNRAVGAHQAHLKSSTWRAPLSCNQCHKVPATLFAAGHLGASPAELTFSGLAVTDGATPSFNGTTCSGSYCHGATLDGGQHTAPTWTKVDGTQSSCSSCHGDPPGGTHPQNTSCSSCHGAVVDASKKIIAPNLHINGKVEVTSYHPAGYAAGSTHGPDFFQNKATCQNATCHGATLTGSGGPSCDKCHSGWKTNCVFCHGGTDNQTGAPPVSVSGATSTSVRGVGAHSAHVGSSTRHASYDCATCHLKPADALSAGHINGSTAIQFSGIASGASYNATSGQCSNVYCHGNGRGSNGSASWTGTIGSGCNTCHDDAVVNNNTLSENHKKHFEKGITDCSRCHSCVINSNGTFNTPSRHVDGTVDDCFATGAHCAAGCHRRETW